MAEHIEYTIILAVLLFCLCLEMYKIIIPEQNEALRFEVHIQVNMDVERYAFRQTVGTRKVVVANPGTLVISEYEESDDSGRNVVKTTSKQVKLPERDFSHFLDILYQKLDMVKQNIEVKATPIERKNMVRKGPLFVACFTYAEYMGKGLIHFRSFFRKEKGQKFVATRSGVTIRVADELKDFGEILEPAILAGTTAGSLSRRQIVNEADDITRRNPDLAYSDIGRIVGQAIKVGSKTYVHRQAVSNIMAARLIRDTVVNMHVQQEATQYATEGDHPQDAQELEADYAYSQELLTD